MGGEGTVSGVRAAGWCCTVCDSADIDVLATYIYWYPRKVLEQP